MGTINDENIIETLKRVIQDAAQMHIDMSKRLSFIIEGGMYRNGLPLEIREDGNFCKCTESSEINPDAIKIIEYYETEHENIYKKLFDDSDDTCLNYFIDVNTRIESKEKKHRFSKSRKFVMEFRDYFILDKGIIELLKLTLEYCIAENIFLNLQWSRKKGDECIKSLNKGMKKKEEQFWKIYKLQQNLKESSGISEIKTDLLGILILERGCLYHIDGGLIFKLIQKLKVMNETTKLYEVMREKKMRSSIEPTKKPRGFFVSGIEYSKNEIERLQGRASYTKKNNQVDSNKDQQ